MKKIIEYGAYLLVFLLPWQTVWIIQEKMIGRAGTSFEGVWQYGTTRLYVLEVFVVFLMMLFLWQRLKQLYVRGIRRAFSAWRSSRFFLLDWCLGFFVFLSLGSILWSPDKGVAVFAALRIVEGIFLFFFFRTTQLNFFLLVTALVGGAVIQSTIAIGQFFIQTVVASTLLGISTHDPAVLGTAVIQAADRRWLRAYGAFPHPNVLGAYLAVAFLMCGVALTRAKEKWHWILLLAASQIILIGLLFTFSRSAWISSLLGGVLTILVSFFRRPSGESNKDIIIHPVVVLALASVITASIFTAYFFDEMKGRIGIAPSRLEYQSIDERLSSLSRAAPLLQGAWYRGTGIGNFTNALFLSEKERGIDDVSYSYQPLHNVFFMIFAELGIVGILLFVLSVLYYIRTLPSTLYPLGPLSLRSLSLDTSIWNFFCRDMLGVGFSPAGSLLPRR